MSDDPITDLAKKSIEESAKIAEKFLGKLISPALEEGGGILSDTMKFWRFKNQINLVLKAQAFLTSRGIDPVRILPKTLIPILEHGSLEEDSEMQDRWAALLAHAADPILGQQVRPSYPEILKQLSPIEARILEAFYDSMKDVPIDDREKHGMIKARVLDVFSLSDEEYKVIVDSLVRLGICQWPTSLGGVTIGDSPMILRSYDFISLSPLGSDFIKACKLA